MVGSRGPSVTQVRVGFGMKGKVEILRRVLIGGVEF